MYRKVRMRHKQLFGSCVRYAFLYTRALFRTFTQESTEYSTWLFGSTFGFETSHANIRHDLGLKLSTASLHTTWIHYMFLDSIVPGAIGSVVSRWKAVPSRTETFILMLQVLLRNEMRGLRMNNHQSLVSSLDQFSLDRSIHRIVNVTFAYGLQMYDH